MEAIILAGGLGTRLQKIVSDVPKPMASISGRPFLEILLTSLARKNTSRIILSVGYMGNLIKEHFGNSFGGMEIEYAHEEAPLGTGGAIRLSMEKVRSDHVFVFNGDTFLDLELDRVEKQWQQRHRSIIVGRNVSEVSRYGRLLTDKGHVVGFSEKGVSGSGIINAGCYVISREQLSSFAPQVPFSFERDFLPKVVKKGEFDVFITNGKFIDIGVPDDYLRAQSVLLEQSYETAKFLA